ncbi:sterol desaturase family protein [Streptomyces capoamus]|uniref:C-5 sterol desaturase n=1 Tax=Streptomyces capoamus TaxID=68183 RepID=A0A919EZS2_9ACTN|nr:sterol desaturase family protein [Streptomyces capoamus]GGW18024.1 C-5 sterol desaturase [Streptomyces libani subsp. rufus]GHG63493.1 C-5 sterol desaturase [Streptomyces capoamus]
MLDKVIDRLHDPAVYAMPAMALLIVIELLAIKFGDDPDGRQGYDPRDHRASIITGLGALVSSTLLRTVALALYLLVYEYVAPWHLSPTAWTTWFVVFWGVEFLLYWYHRAAHAIRLIWAGHQVHHSSQYLNLSTALRRKWAQWFEKMVWLPLPLLGVHPAMVFTMHSVHLLWGLFAHTEKIRKLPRPIEYVFVTPSHHRVHHGSDPEYLDKNFGSILIIWDRIFGTFQPELHRPTYGLTKQLETYSIWKIQLHEFATMVRDVRGARTLRHKLGYVFGPPGWQPAEDTGAGHGDRPEPKSAAVELPGAAT